MSLKQSTNTISQTFLLATSPARGFSVFLLVVMAALLPRLEMSREYSQHLLFPFFLLALWQLPRSRRYRVSGYIVLGIAFVWLVSLLNLNGYLPRFRQNPTLVSVSAWSLTKNVNDGGLPYSREYNQRVRSLELPLMEPVERISTADRDLRDWISQRRGVIAAVVEDPRWSPVVSSPNNILRNLAQATRAVERKEFGVAVYEWRPFRRDRAILVAGVPLRWDLPLDPHDASQNFLAWYAEGIRPLEPGEKLGAALDKRSAALRAASGIDSYWQSHTPLGVAEYVRGTLLMFEAELLGEDQMFDEALAAFGKAAGYIDARRHPELAALVYNNAAATLLARGIEDDSTKKQFRKWIGRALNFEKRGGVNKNAFLALHNLHQCCD